MATWQMRDDSTADEPVTCALASADRAAQADRWKQIANRAMTRRAQTAGGIRVSFRNDSGVEASLRQLTAIESECCAWATWIVEKRDEELLLDVSSTSDEGITALHGMLTGL